MLSRFLDLTVKTLSIFNIGKRINFTPAFKVLCLLLKSFMYLLSAKVPRIETKDNSMANASLIQTRILETVIVLQSEARNH